MILTEKDDFAQALSSYRAGGRTWHQVVGLLREAQAQLRSLERDLELRAAEIRFEHLFLGKNAEDRAAEMAIALRADTAYCTTLKVADGIRLDVARYQDDAAQLRDRISGFKRQMDFIISWVKFAAQEGEEENDD